jgi:hypothetical protein
MIEARRNSEKCLSAAQSLQFSGLGERLGRRSV